MTANLLTVLPQITIAYAVGLFAPGYLIARLLGARAAWALALPLSMAFLLLCLLALGAVGLPISFASVVALLAAFLASLGMATRLALARGLRAPSPVFASPALAAAPAGADADAPPSWHGLLVAGVGLILALAVVRGFLAPLSGPDTIWRWDFLARQLERRHSLDFYPPVRAEDFRSYFVPEGFAPLISTAIWWIYAAAGRPVPEATAPLELLQYASLLGLAFQIAERLHSKRAAWYSVAILAATPMLFREVMVGQETGLTALAVAGAVHVLLHARGPGDLRAPVLAGLLAAAVALAREYGLAFAACAVAVIVWRRLGWRALVAFCVALAVPLVPWLLRNLLRSGNPFFSIGLGIFPVNPVYSAVIAHRHLVFGLGTIGLGSWLAMAKFFAFDAPWPLLLGLPATVVLARRCPVLVASTAVGIALWLDSVGYTNGGLGYSTRVLTPAILALSIGAAIALAERSPSTRRQHLATAALTASLVVAAARSAIFPYIVPDELIPRALPKIILEQTEHTEQAVVRLAEALPSGARILGDNQNAHAALVNAGSSHEVVPVWSPEVAFLFDSSLTPEARAERLASHRIGAVLLIEGSDDLPLLQETSPFYAEDLRLWIPAAPPTDDCVLLVPGSPSASSQPHAARLAPEGGPAL